MRRSAPARCRSRRAHFEQYEDRLVLSSVPGTEPPADHPSELVYRLPETVDLIPTSYLGTYSSGNSPQLQYLRETYGLEGTGQTIAIIDSGIAYDHVAFGSGFGTGYQVVGGWDFTEERDGNPYDDGPAGFHGTHVAGIVASQDSTHPGVAPGVDVVALRVFNDQGIGYAAWLEEALQWVHDHRDAFRYPITTVNMSLGASWNGSSPPAWAMLEDELAQLTQDGIFIAAAAGNSFASYQAPGLAYPAAGRAGRVYRERRARLHLWGGRQRQRLGSRLGHQHGHALSGGSEHVGA
jgi:subtilisin family serine protease